MTKLEQLLIKQSEKIVKSQTTYSVYYYIGNIKIRISDHTHTRDGDDLFVYIPVNDVRNRFYIVTLPESNKFLCWTAKQIMDFIPFLQLQKEMLTVNMKVQPAPVINSDKKIPDVKTEELKITLPLVKVLPTENLPKERKVIVCRGRSAWKFDEIELLPKILEVNLKTTNIVLNDDFKIFLSNTPLTYKEALNIYDIIVNDNKKEITIDLCNLVLTRLSGG